MLEFLCPYQLLIQQSILCISRIWTGKRRHQTVNHPRLLFGSLQKVRAMRYQMLIGLTNESKERECWNFCWMVSLMTIAVSEPCGGVPTFARTLDCAERVVWTSRVNICPVITRPRDGWILVLEKGKGNEVWIVTGIKTQPQFNHYFITQKLGLDINRNSQKWRENPKGNKEIWELRKSWWMMKRRENLRFIIGIQGFRMLMPKE